MKKLTESRVKNIKEKLIIFKNELIRKNKINNRDKKDLDDIIIVILNTEVLRILDICLMKRIFIMVLMILNICLVKMKAK